MFFKIPNSTFQASADVYPATFVTLSDEYIVTQATTGDAPIGVTALGTKTFNVSVIAQVGDPVGVYTNGQECWLQVGGTVSAGNKLKPNTSGYGIATTGTEHAYAVALSGGSANDLVKVRLGLQQ